MSMSVCLSVREDISGTTRAIFINFVCMLPMAVALSSSGRMTKFRGEGAAWGFPPMTMRCTARHLRSVQKRLNRSRCRLGRSVGLAQGVVCYVGVTIADGEGAILFEGKRTYPTNVTPLWIVNWTGPCSGVHTIRADAWLQALDESN